MSAENDFPDDYPMIDHPSLLPEAFPITSEMITAAAAVIARAAPSVDAEQVAADALKAAAEKAERVHRW